jgi:hypothetical protein
LVTPPLHDLRRHYEYENVKGDVDAAVRPVLASGRYILGDAVRIALARFQPRTDESAGRGRSQC